MKITNKKSMAETKEVKLNAIDCREAIAHWLRSEHGLQVGRQDVTFLSSFDHTWNETVFEGASVLSFKFVEPEKMVQNLEDHEKAPEEYEIPEKI